MVDKAEEHRAKVLLLIAQLPSLPPEAPRLSERACVRVADRNVGGLR
jgi:hypothetical protein